MGEREGAQRAGRGEGETEAALRGAGGRRGSGRLGLGWGSPRKCQGQAWAAPRQAGRRRSPFRSLPQQRGAREGACLGGEVTRAAGASEGGEALCQHQAASEAGVTVRPLWRRAPRRPQGPSFLPGVLENYRGSGHALGGSVPQAPSSSPPPPCTAPVSCRTLSCPTPPPTGLQAGGAAGLQLSVPPKGRARSWAPLGSGS